MKVEKGVEMPKRKRESKYPWAKLKVGDSFYVESANVTSNGMYSCVSTYNKKVKKPIKISVRKEGEGIRVWRIK